MVVSRMMRAFLLLLGVLSFCFGEQELFHNPTERFLEEHTIEDIKYHLRLDGVTLEYKTLFDKIILSECEGLMGYHGDSREYRIYQDLIKIVIEEVVGISVPKDFHFLAIPALKEEKLGSLQDIPTFFSPERNLGYRVSEQLFPINMALYGNYNSLGFNSVKNFTLNFSSKGSEKFICDLKSWFCQLGLNDTLVDEAYAIGASLLPDDRGILLQLFDVSSVSYEFADRLSYPAYPNGYPYANKNMASYHYEPVAVFPPEIALIMTSRELLSPFSPLVIKRYDKLQPSVVKKYETALRDGIRIAERDDEKVKPYRQKLLDMWDRSQGEVE